MRRGAIGVVLVGLAMAACSGSDAVDADGGADADGLDADGVGADADGADSDADGADADVGTGGGTPGVGGAPTGGTPGSGGTLSSGGTPSSGGDAGTGGAAGTGATSSGGAGSGGAAADDVADIEACDAYANWNETDRAREQAILTAVNQNRGNGTDCAVAKSPVGNLTMDPLLRCAARKHAKDMADRDYFSHGTWNASGTVCTDTCAGGLTCDDENDAGTKRCLNGPGQRLGALDYSGSTWGENIAAGNSDASGTMTQWLTSSGHCNNIMSGSFTKIGVGYAAGGRYGHVWVQVFGN